MNSLSPATLLSRGLIGAVGLSVSAIALLGIPESAQAASTCGPGFEWVRTCEPGTDKFRLSWAYLDLWLMPPNQPMEQLSLVLSGPATVERGTPTQDPLDGSWYIPTTITEKFTTSGITLKGTGTGRIIENPQDTRLASSFFDVFATIEGDFGKARNMDPVHVDGDRWLQGVPPDVIPGVFPPPPLPVEPDPQCGVGTSPLATIIYCGFQDTDFFLVDDDDNFILDQDGNRILVATLHGEQHVVHPPIPEPSTTVPLALLGLAGLWGLRKKQLVK